MHLSDRTTSLLNIALAEVAIFLAKSGWLFNVFWHPFHHNITPYRYVLSGEQYLPIDRPWVKHVKRLHRAGYAIDRCSQGSDFELCDGEHHYQAPTSPVRCFPSRCLKYADALALLLKRKAIAL